MRGDGTNDDATAPSSPVTASAIGEATFCRYALHLREHGVAVSSASAAGHRRAPGKERRAGPRGHRPDRAEDRADRRRAARSRRARRVSGLALGVAAALLAVFAIVLLFREPRRRLLHLDRGAGSRVFESVRHGIRAKPDELEQTGGRHEAVELVELKSRGGNRLRPSHTARIGATALAARGAGLDVRRARLETTDGTVSVDLDVRARRGAVPPHPSAGRGGATGCRGRRSGGHAVACRVRWLRPPIAMAARRVIVADVDARRGGIKDPRAGHLLFRRQCPPVGPRACTPCAASCAPRPCGRAGATSMPRRRGDRYRRHARKGPSAGYAPAPTGPAGAAPRLRGRDRGVSPQIPSTEARG